MDYHNFDNLGLFLAFIKSVSVNYSNKTVTIFMAKPYNHRENKLRYVETELVLENVRIMDFEQNLIEVEVPEFHRSAMLKEHPSYILNEEVVYYFGVDWGSKYCHWYFVAKSHKLNEITAPLEGSQLTWVH